MIENLPEQINTAILNKFDFGSSEANKDQLLQDCYCDIAPIRTFLQGKKSILVGAKGSGKTAVFTLIKRGHLKFENAAKGKTVIINIDEPIEYATASKIIDASLKTKVNEEPVRYQFLWEIYLLYRICLALRSRGELQIIKDKLDSLCNLFSGDKPRVTLFQLLTTSKKTIGFKLDMKNPAFPTPDFYISTEPTSAASPDDHLPVTIDIEGFKADIQTALEKQGLYVYLLVDNLDDFVARDDYKIQKMILHGIINCCRNYAKYSKLRLKISIRSDLFHKLDFSQLGGYDKIISDTVDLIWKDADIRHFMSRRIAFNLISTLHLKGLKVHFEKESLYLPPPERKQSLIRKSVNYIAKLFHRKSRLDESDARTISIRDQMYREVITSVFPREVLHRTGAGNQEKYELFSYFASHFDLGDDHTTPRIILLFMQKLAQITADYYRENPDETILRRTDKKEFALFKRHHFLTAYAALQKDMIEIFKSCMTVYDWQLRTDMLFAKKGKKISFKFPLLCSIVDLEGDDAKAYIAYLTHLGVLSCKNAHLPHRERSYQFPLLLQCIWENEV